MHDVKIKKLQVLKLLDGKLPFNFQTQGGITVDGGVTVEEWPKAEIGKFLAQNKAEFKKNVFYCSKSFTDATSRSEKALLKAMAKDFDYLLKGLHFTTGVFLTQLTDDVLAVFYKFDTEAKALDVAVFSSDGVFFAASKNTFVKFDDGSLEITAYKMSIHHMFPKVLNTMMINCININLLMVTLFRTYSDHEIAVVNRSKKVLNSVTYKSDNPYNISILDSSWYTSIVRNEGFLVNGHLKMQSCGVNHSERKLIYVDTYEKKGYVRKAKMLDYQTESISEINART